MHEVSVCQSMLKMVEDEMDPDDVSKVREIHIKIGLLSYIEPNLLKHVFSFVKEDTPFEHCELVISMIDIEATCDQCGQTFQVEKYKFICPHCEIPLSNIVHGQEFLIHKILLEETAYEEVDQ